MKCLARVLAACAASASLVSPALAAAPRAPLPAALPIIDVTSARAPVTGMQLFVPAGLDRQPRNRSGLAAVVAQAIVRTPVDGAPVTEAIERAGGSLTYAVDGQETHFYLEATPSHFAQVASLFADALAAPSFDRRAVAAAAAYVTRRSRDANEDGLQVCVAMYRSVYLAKTNAGLTSWGNPATVAQITTGDVGTFFRKNYVARGAMIVGGGVGGAALSEGEQAVARALPDRPAGAVVASGELPIRAVSRELVTHRDVPAPWVVLGYSAPAPGTPDFAAALVLQSLIGQAVGRGLAPPLVAMPTDAQEPVGSLYLYDTVPSAVVVYANGAAGDPSIAVRTVATVIDTLTASPLSNRELKLAKAQATGDFLLDQSTISDRTWMVGNFAREGAGDDYAARVLPAIAAVTPRQLQLTARRYFEHYTTAVVLPREGPQ